MLASRDQNINVVLPAHLKISPRKHSETFRRVSRNLLPLSKRSDVVPPSEREPRVSTRELGDMCGDYVVKRVMDVGVSGVLLLFLLPFLAMVWAVVRVTSRGPGLYWSRRVGFGGRIFMMPKFRTMPVGTRQIAREAFEAGGGCTTSIGQFLRKLSIDELPQLWSVLVGDMSLVGPRPLLGNDPTTAIRQSRFPQCFGVRPGITGLAQVKGRNSVKPLAKARYDAFYAVRCSLGVDVHILLATARAVLDVRRIL